MDQTQNDSFGSLSNDQGGNMQTGGGVGGLNNVGMNGQKIVPPMPISTGGPIVLNNNDGRRSKKWLVALIAVLIIAAVTGGVFAVMQLSFHSSNTDALASILEEGRDEVHQAEVFFDNVDNGEISFKLLYQDNEEGDLVVPLLTSLSRFKEQLGEIDRAGLDAKLKEPFLELENTLNQRLSLYEKIGEICTVFYEVYNSPDSINSADELKGNSNKYIANLAHDFYSYYEKKVQIMSDMEKNDCGVELFSNICEEKYDEYYQNEKFMDDGNILSEIMADMTTQEGYGDGFAMSDLINELLYIIEGIKNEREN